MQREELERDMASIDVDALDEGVRRELEATIGVGYPADVVVPPPKTWDQEVESVGLEYSKGARIPWQGSKRDSATLIKQEPATRAAVTTIIASIASPNSAHWNNSGIAHAWLRELEDAQRAFNAAVATGVPEAEAKLARNNRTRLQKLKAIDVIRRAAGQ
jgi:hypothetical protein